MRSHSLKSAVNRINYDEVPYNNALKEFVDGFFLDQDKDFQSSLIQEEFTLLDREDHKMISVAIVLIVEEVADIAGIPAPDWCKKEYYYYDEPFFATKNKELQKIYYDEATIFSKNHNFFCNRLISVFHTKKKKPNLENLT